MPSYDVIFLGFGVIAIVLSSYWGRVRAREMGGSVARNTSRSIIFGAAVLLVALADYASVQMGWGSFLRLLSFRF